MAGAEAQPFLKWVGGKSQLLAQFDRFFPREIERYVEPFIGGGAVFFHLKARFPKMQASLRDDNAELINCYQAVRDNVKELMRRLDEHVRQFQTEGERYYYLVRSQHQLTDPLERAARMIFLNKTCFNGLWRVNGRGEFNVPIGSYKKISLYDRNNLLFLSCPLVGASSVNCSAVQLLGSRVAVANAELRFPLLRRVELGLLPIALPPIEGLAFYDVGVAWSKDQTLYGSRPGNYDPNVQRFPLRSYGFGLRLNLFNYAILRWDYAVPLDGAGSRRGFWTWSLWPSF